MRTPRAPSPRPARLKIGLAFNAPLAGAELDPVCEQAARDAATQLESLGHQVQEITPPWSSPELLPYFSRLFGPAVSMTTWIGGRLAGRDPTEEDVEPLTWEIWERARDQDTITYLMAENRLQSVGRSLVQFLAPFDVVITPALAQRPLRTGEVHGRGPDPWDHFRRSGLFTPYTAICNVIGLPAISLPLYQGDDGLPAAVQVIGRPAAEDVLLSLAGQLEAALPWARPPAGRYRRLGRRLAPASRRKIAAPAEVAPIDTSAAQKIAAACASVIAWAGSPSAITAAGTPT